VASPSSWPLRTNHGRRRSRTNSDRSHAASAQDAIGGAVVVVFAVWLDTIKDLIAKHARLLENTVVVDPSNPLEFDENGQMIRTLPDDQSVGSIALAAGIGLIVDAAATNSSATSLVGSIAGGFGFGAAFLGGTRTRREDPAPTPGRR